MEYQRGRNGVSVVLSGVLCSSKGWFKINTLQYPTPGVTYIHHWYTLDHPRLEHYWDATEIPFTIIQLLLGNQFFVSKSNIQHPLWRKYFTLKGICRTPHRRAYSHIVLWNKSRLHHHRNRVDFVDGIERYFCNYHVNKLRIELRFTRDGIKICKPGRFIGKISKHKQNRGIWLVKLPSHDPHSKWWSE
jgi:hypothetical protein